MPLRALVERRVKAGYEGMVWYILRELRSEAVRARGYLYGETWRSVEDPRRFMVLSVWASLDYWNRWAQSDYRLKAEERLKPLLRGPASVKLFEDAPEPGP